MTDIILKHLSEIKDIVSKITTKPGKQIYESDLNNSYFICGDFLLVKVKIHIPYHIFTKYAYFLIDSDDKDLLKGRTLQAHMDTVDVEIRDIIDRGMTFEKIYTKKDFGKNTNKHFVTLNSNPFDFRSINMTISINRKKSIKNKSGTTGVSRCGNGWIATFYRKGKTKTKFYATKKYGRYKAKEMAEEKRKKWENEFINKI